MAHNLSVVRGEEEMFYVGETPWHRLGIKLPEVATAQEAIDAAGLGWDVILGDIFFKTDEGMKQVEHQKAAIRDDATVALAVVSDNYKPIHNREAFAFFDQVVGTGDAKYHTAGALGQGQKVWMLAELPGEVRLQNDRDDVTQKYLLLTTGHDGKTALRMLLTPVRVVCQNTLNAAIGGVAASEGVTIYHSGDVKLKVREAQRILGLAVSHYNEFEEQANWLSGIEASVQTVEKYVEALFIINPESSDRQQKHVLDIRSDVENRFGDERGRSLWHLVNAAVEYVDHGQSFRSSNAFSRQEGRFRNVLMGSGAKMKHKAFELVRTVATSGVGSV